MYPDGRIAQALRRPPAGAVHLVSFIPAGFGGMEATAAAVRAVAMAGASVIEVGLPFSDPIADGPVIQAAYQEALQRGTTVQSTLDLVGELRGEVSVPMLAMVSYSLVFRAGHEPFCAKARAAGLQGILCPDLPPPEAASFCGAAREAGLEPVLLVAPGTSAARRDEIGRLAGGFVYYLSVAGTTGERAELPADLADGVADMRSRTDLPICVGFGISRPEQVRGLAGVADGAIVGSAYVRRMADALAAGPEAVARDCAGLTRELTG
jgi:tryptophan synthase alpha chain